MDNLMNNFNNPRVTDFDYYGVHCFKTARLNTRASTNSPTSFVNYKTCQESRRREQLPLDKRKHAAVTFPNVIPPEFTSLSIIAFSPKVRPLLERR